MEDNNDTKMLEHLEGLVFKAHIKDLNLHKKNKKELQEEILRLREEINTMIDGFKDAWEKTKKEIEDDEKENWWVAWDVVNEIDDKTNYEMNLDNPVNELPDIIEYIQSLEKENDGWRADDKNLTKIMGMITDDFIGVDDIVDIVEKLKEENEKLKEINRIYEKLKELSSDDE